QHVDLVAPLRCAGGRLLGEGGGDQELPGQLGSGVVGVQDLVVRGRHTFAPITPTGASSRPRYPPAPAPGQGASPSTGVRRPSASSTGPVPTAAGTDGGRVRRLVEQEPRSPTATCRSSAPTTSTAYRAHARTSSTSRSGKQSRTIRSNGMASATSSGTSRAGIRVPATQGLPKRTSGSTTTRSAVAVAHLAHP